MVAAKYRLSERWKAEIRHRAFVGRHVENLERKNEALTEVRTHSHCTAVIAEILWVWQLLLLGL